MGLVAIVWRNSADAAVVSATIGEVVGIGSESFVESNKAVVYVKEAVPRAS